MIPIICQNKALLEMKAVVATYFLTTVSVNQPGDSTKLDISRLEHFAKSCGQARFLTFLAKTPGQFR